MKIFSADVKAPVRKDLGPEDPDLAIPLESYLLLLRNTGRSDEATRLEARANAIRAKIRIRIQHRY